MKTKEQWALKDKARLEKALQSAADDVDYWIAEVATGDKVAQELAAELAALKARRCETCADHDKHAVDEPCDRFSDSFLAFMRDHCKGKPVSCCFWTERGVS